MASAMQKRLQSPESLTTYWSIRECGEVVMVSIDGAEVLKVYYVDDTGRHWLLPANPKYPPIEVTDANDFTIWGVVTYVIKKVTHHA